MSNATFISILSKGDTYDTTRNLSESIKSLSRPATHQSHYRHADVSGSSIDLVAADLFLNPVGASLTASDGWRIFARTPDGEERGGLQGDGEFDVFGCTFGQENCLGIGEGNQFIYQEQRFRQLPAAPETVTEWLDEDEREASVVELLQAAICPIPDPTDPLQAGASRDELGQEWLKSRHRLRLNNCIDNNNAPGCRF